MNPDRENRINKAIDAYKKGMTLRTAAAKFNVPRMTLHGRLHGAISLKEQHTKNQLLTPVQECILEQAVINLVKLKHAVSSQMVMEMAGRILRMWNKPEDTPSINPSKMWLTGFLSRSRCLSRDRRNKISVRQVDISEERSIELFFENLAHLEEQLEVTMDRVWNLDETKFNFEKTPNSGYCISPPNHPDITLCDTSKPVTVLEFFSRDGEIQTPLIIYKDPNAMKTRIFKGHSEEAVVCISPFSSVDQDFSVYWFTQHFKFLSDQWQILIMDGRNLSNALEFIDTAYYKRVVPLFFPSGISNIVQESDRALFRTATQEFEHGITFQEDCLSPSNTNFLVSYMKIRRIVYTPETLKKAYETAGICPRLQKAGLQFFKSQIEVSLTKNNNDPASSELFISSQNAEINTTLGDNAKSKANSWRTERMKLLRTPVSALVTMLKEEREKTVAQSVEIARLKQELSELYEKTKECKSESSIKEPVCD